MLGLTQAIAWPWSREIKHIRAGIRRAGIRRDALQDCSIPSSCRHADRHITFPPFEEQTQKSKLLALWQVAPPRHTICPDRHFFSVFRG